MKTYSNGNEMWRSAIASVLTRGEKQQSRNGSTLELLGWSGILAYPERAFVSDPLRAARPDYLSAELLWHAAGCSQVLGMLDCWAPRYTRWAEADGTAYGAWGARWCRGLGFVHALLSREPDSRQAVLSTFQERDLVQAVEKAAGGPGKKDLPCCASLQFLVRSGRLVVYCSMRSNDLWLGFPCDLFLVAGIQRLLASWLGLRPGSLHWHVASLHLYRPHVLKCAEAGYCQHVPDLDLPGFEPVCLDQEVSRGHVGQDFRAQALMALQWLVSSPGGPPSLDAARLTEVPESHPLLLHCQSAAYAGLLSIHQLVECLESGASPLRWSPWVREATRRLVDRARESAK